MNENKSSLGRTLAIIAAIFAGIIAVVAVAVRLYSKYCLLNEPVEEDDEIEPDDELDDEEIDAVADEEEIEK